MGYFNKRKSSGVFIPSGSSYKEYAGEKGSGSINDISLCLGYNQDQIYSIFNRTEKKDRLLAVVFEIFTRNILFILTTPDVTYITEKDVRRHLGRFSVSKEFDSLRVNDVLTSGIENETLTVDFLAKVLKLKDVSPNGMFYSEQIKTYLYFTNGILTNFHYDDGFFPMARFLREVNRTVYNLLVDIANRYWGNNYFQAQKEINIQSEAWSAIPDAFGNEFISLHRTENGGANLHMLRVVHYNYPITLEQFKEINHGRYKPYVENNIVGMLMLKCGLYKYTFDLNTGDLLNAELSNLV
jgi:hypothetical protein